MTIEKFNINLLLNERELEAFHFALISARERLRHRIASGWEQPSDLQLLASLTKIADAAKVRDAHWKN